MKRAFKLGFLVNPYAGAGGPAALKGSDAPATRQAIESGQIKKVATGRAKVFLRALEKSLFESNLAETQKIECHSISGEMGGDLLQSSSWPVHFVPYQSGYPSTAEDTRSAVKTLCKQNIDLLVFVGGDGTARDVCQSVDKKQLCLGVPAGVKMQSAVYAISPQTAAHLVKQLICAELVKLAEREVRDLDEAAYILGQVKSQYFGSLWVPDDPEFVQNVKQGGLEMDPLVISDIAEQLTEDIGPNTLVILGPGSTTQQVAQCWGCEKTLLGVDAILNGERTQTDLNAAALEELVRAHGQDVLLVLTVMGGQGHIIGRGNQQITASLLKYIGKESVKIIATRTKLLTLEGRPLLIDSGDGQLDMQWQGYIPVLTGYNNQVLYPVGYP